MKKLTILLFSLICTCCIFGQDTLNIKVEYSENTRYGCVAEDFLYYEVNGVFFNDISWIEPKDILNLEVFRSKTCDNGGIISERLIPSYIVITIKDYKPQPISIKNLKTKYTDVGNEPAVFFY